MKANKTQNTITANKPEFEAVTTGELVGKMENWFTQVNWGEISTSDELRDAMMVAVNGSLNWITISFTGHNQGNFHVMDRGVNWCGSFCKGRITFIEKL